MSARASAAAAGRLRLASRRVGLALLAKKKFATRRLLVRSRLAVIFHTWRLGVSGGVWQGPAAADLAAVEDDAAETSVRAAWLERVVDIRQGAIRAADKVDRSAWLKEQLEGIAAELAQGRSGTLWALVRQLSGKRR